MNEEEYFRKNYPDSCYGDKPLSPHWDFFQDGVEFGERESEKRIEELEKENAELKDALKGKVCKCMTYFNFKDLENKLTNAKEIILRLYNAGRDVLMCRTEEKAYDNLSNAVNDKRIEQFLKELNNEEKRS